MWPIAAVGALVVLAIAISLHRAANRWPVRHVVVISLDTTRPDHFGCYGNTWIRTPNVDRLAAESILFTNYMTVVPTTLASHTSLFTGQYPHTHGVARNGFMVNRANVMLAEVLKKAGWHTFGFAASFSLDSRFDFAQGFDHYDETFDRLVGDRGADQSQRSAQAVTDAVIQYLDRTGTPSHLFLFVHYFDPHAPYDPPAPYDKMYDPDGAIDLPHYKAVYQWHKDSPGQANDLALTLAKRYAGEVSYMDEHVGRLVTYLKTRGILDDALLIVTSDHGENFWRRQDYFDHGLTTYQTAMSAMYMVRLPDLKHAGTKVDQLVANIDVFPTILKYIGLNAPESIDGEAIDLADDKVIFAPRTRFGEATKPYENVETDPRWTNNRKARCIRQGSLKYIHTPFMETEEMYDLSVDPDEAWNLLQEPAPQISATAKALRDQLDSWAASATPLSSRFDPRQRQETIQRLKALGYLGGP